MNYVLDEVRLQQHHDNNFSEKSVFALRNEFARNGFIKLRDIVDQCLPFGAFGEFHQVAERGEAVLLASH